MSPVIVVIADVLVHQALQVAFIENDHVIEQIPAAGSNEVLRHAVLPGALEASALGLNAEALDCFNDFLIETPTAIEDQVLWRGIIWKGLAQLLDYPCTCRMFSDIEVQNSSPIMGDDEEAV